MIVVKVLSFYDDGKGIKVAYLNVYCFCSSTKQSY